jgi:hypothetical protein
MPLVFNSADYSCHMKRQQARSEGRLGKSKKLHFEFFMGRLTYETKGCAPAAHELFSTNIHVIASKLQFKAIKS